MNREKPYCDCPKFDHFEYEHILEWAETNFDAKVIWEEDFYSHKHGVRKLTELAHWLLSWKKGFIGFDHLHENTEENKQKARMTAALFIYLWCIGVDAGLADNLATHYVLNVEIERVRAK